VTLFDLLKAYGTHPVPPVKLLRIAPLNLFSMDDALKRNRRHAGPYADWTGAADFLRMAWKRRCSAARAGATFAATLNWRGTGR